MLPAELGEVQTETWSPRTKGKA